MIVLNTRMQIFFVLFVVSWLFVVASNFFRSLFGPTSGPTPLELTPLSSPLQTRLNTSYEANTVLHALAVKLVNNVNQCFL